MVDGDRSAPVQLKHANSRKQKLPFKVKVTQHPVAPSQRSSGLETPADTSRAFSHLRSRYMDMISPRSSNYERLEGGHGPSRTGAAKRFAWKKFAVIAVAFIALVYLFGPRESRSLPWKSTVPAPSPSHPYDEGIDEPLPVKPSKGGVKHPESYEEDPDPTKTTHCVVPYEANDSLVQYALMVDAGSTGSRIHIYKFNNCGPSASYEYEVFKMTHPGLSHFAGHPEDAAKSLDVLLDEAVRVVPKSMHGCTPIAIKATAGLRLLPGSQSADILHAVEERIHKSYPFKLQDKDGVVIMDGKDEGVYAWITANYLFDTIKSDTLQDTPTYAVLDLGGGSTQIVFEPRFSSPHQKLEDGEHKYDLKFGGRTHVLYQHSYLGYGLKLARRHVHRLVDFMATLHEPSTKEKAEGIVGNPCLARGTSRIVEIEDIEDEEASKARNVTMHGEEIGSFHACDRVVQLVLAKDSICEMKPCSFNGVYQPSLLDTFPNGKVLLLSYFYDRISPLVPPSARLTVSTIAETAKDVCLGREQWLKKDWAKNPAVMAELDDRPEWCLDLTFMHALLQLGYEFPDTREVQIGKKIRETELGWCLGATIAMVGGELTCRD